MAKDADRKETLQPADTTRHGQGDRPDFSKPLPRKRLPKDLQARLDKEDNEDPWRDVYDGTAPESTDTSVRYAAYASRVRTILLSAQRYVAYTSDIGESFRPIAHPYLVKGAYAISWTYLAGDVAHEGYKAYLRNQHVLYPEKFASRDSSSPQDNSIVSEGAAKLLDKSKSGADAVADKVGSSDTTAITAGKIVPIEDYRAVMAQRAVFQGVASMGLPAFTIHSIVRYSGQAMKSVKNVTIRTWGPIGLGLAAVPALPFVFDEPVEKATEYVFHKAFEMVGGPSAVGHTPNTGRQEQLQRDNKASDAKEKEL